MVKITLKVDGMSCPMCEAHVNDAVRTKFKIKKVSSSYKKGITEIIAENEIAKDELVPVFEQVGYRVLNIDIEPYEKRGFLFWHK